MKKFIQGLEEWKSAAGHRLSHWDRWFLTLLVADHGGSWSSLEAAIQERSWLHSFEARDREAKLAHLTELRRRLEGAGLDPVGVLGDDATDKGLTRKARTKVFEQEAQERYKTEAMRRTPRRVLSERALRGNWAAFPVSPSRFESAFLDEVARRSHYSVSATSGLCRRLDKLHDRTVMEAGEEPAQSLAVRRAFLTALIEAADRADDSCGVLGQLFEERLAEYFTVSWRDAGLTPEAYYRDFLEFATWEDYGFIWRRLGPFFRAVTAGDFDLVAAHLRRIHEELADAHLEYRAEEALTLLGELHVAKRRFGCFVELAHEMGSRHWERITRMAELAWWAGRGELAVEIFGAANQPGYHQDYLRRRCLDLTGREPPERPHLTVVPGLEGADTSKRSP